MLVSEFMEGYMKNTLGKKTKEGNWGVINWGHMDVLQYYPSDVPKASEDVAYRLPGGEVVVNANRLKYVGKSMAWGNEARWATEQNQRKIQSFLENLGGILLPFTLFSETGMDIRDFEWVQKPIPGGETVKIKEKENHYFNEFDRYVIRERHFVGAMVFKIGNEFILFDIDRKEIENGIFNAFIVKLPEPVGSVEEAYKSLRPQEVKDATEKGVDVQRQGEFFFIKVGDECPVKVMLTDEELRILRHPPSKWGFGLAVNRGWIDDSSEITGKEELTPLEEEYQREAKAYNEVRLKFESITPTGGTISSVASAGHEAESYVLVDGTYYVRGKVKHSRREHGELNLEGWYKVVSNRAVQSFTIRGEID